MKRMIIVLAGVLFLAPLSLVGVAQATTPSGVTSTTLGRVSLGPYHETSAGFKLFSKDPTDTVVTTTTIAPGGPAFIVVTQGTLTVYDGDDPACTPHRYSPGSGFLDAGLGHVHIARNEGTTPVTVVQTYLNVPPGARNGSTRPRPATARSRRRPAEAYPGAASAGPQHPRSVADRRTCRPACGRTG